MADADPRASRASAAPGPDHARVRWTFEADSTELCEPVVLPDGRIVVSGVGARGAATWVLSPEGARLAELPGVGSASVSPVFSSYGLCFAPAEENQVVALTVDAWHRRWTRELAQKPEWLRGTPGGELLVFSAEDRLLCLSRHGSPRWSVPQDLTGAKGRALAAFDGEGNCFIAESGVVFRRGQEITWQVGVSALSPQGEERWSELFDPTDGADVNAIEHIWGLERGAVFFGRSVRCREPSGALRWEIARTEDFARTVRLGEELVLGWDPRLRGGPRLVGLTPRGFRYLPAAIDGSGRAYVCVETSVLSLEGEAQPRWRLALEEPVRGGPVMGPRETVLVRVSGKLLAIG